MENFKSAVFRLPRFHEIPDIGLLLEQTVRLVNGYLEPLGGVSLTPSMVSNYVKHGIVSRAVKKQYGREQIAYLVFIAVAKTVLTLDDIARLIALQQDCCPAQVAYDLFCDEFEAALYDPASCHMEAGSQGDHLREVLCGIAAVTSMCISLRSKLESLGE